MFKFYLPHYNNEKTNYKEFNIQLDRVEQIPENAGVALKHQELISNYMKGSTTIDSLLLVHDMGTGKTCTAIQSIEKNIRDNVYGMQRAIVLNRGKAIMNNFIYELVNKCTTGYKVGNDKTQKALWSKFYTFDTFEIFAKKVRNMSDNYIINNYNNTFLVIDEVHNILNDESYIYNEIQRFITLLPNKRVLLLTGTPVRDKPDDIVPILNLILDEKHKLSRQNFYKEYYDVNGNINTIFKTNIHGKVSYLRASVPEIRVEYEGSRIFELKKYNVVMHKMSKFQTQVYLKAFQKDTSSDRAGIYNNSRQASRFVFPDGTYGLEGYNTYVIDKKFRFKNLMKTELEKYGTDVESKLKRIGEMSSKYEYIIRSIIKADSKGEKTIVYDDLVKGSGLIVFGLLLDSVGFKKFRLLSSETTNTNEISRIQKIFNSNTRGDIISTLLGSRVIAEGFTFLDVLHEHVVPHWNNTETMQVVARGIRMGSHNNILREDPDAIVTVYRNVSIANNDKDSIDYIMTKLSENKDIEIDKVIDAVKEVSVSCNSFIERNGGRCFESKPTHFIIDNYISIGDLERNKLMSIKNYFETKSFCAHIDTLSKTLNIPKEELIKYLFFFISQKIQFTNNKGVTCYLNNNRNVYFLTDNIRTETDVCMSNYTTDLTPYTSENVQEAYEHALDVETNDINSHKNRQRLLELALTVDLCELEVENPYLIQETLNSFKGSFAIDRKRNMASAWYQADIPEERAHPRCLINPVSDTPWLEWKRCPREVEEDLRMENKEKFNKFERELHNRNINYYGLWNPYLKEFCLKNIDLTKIYDKRKIASGKRCVNWSKKELMKIAKDELKMTLDWDVWATSNRDNMCKDIREFLEENNLIMESKSCGVQTKKK